MDKSKQRRLNTIGENMLTVLYQLEKRTDVNSSEIIHVLSSVFWTYVMIHSSPGQIHQNIEAAKKILDAGAEEILPQAEDAWYRDFLDYCLLVTRSLYSLFAVLTSMFCCSRSDLITSFFTLSGILGFLLILFIS